jgi:hypothetical protein
VPSSPIVTGRVGITGVNVTTGPSTTKRPGTGKPFSSRIWIELLPIEFGSGFESKVKTTCWSSGACAGGVSTGSVFTSEGSGNSTARSVPCESKPLPLEPPPPPPQLASVRSANDPPIGRAAPRRRKTGSAIDWIRSPVDIDGLLAMGLGAPPE